MTNNFQLIAFKELRIVHTANDRDRLKKYKEIVESVLTYVSLKINFISKNANTNLIFAEHDDLSRPCVHVIFDSPKELAEILTILGEMQEGIPGAMLTHIWENLNSGTCVIEIEYR